tara:strand:+ start:143 stop:367 length:225 start_codon:yes stop_codon:yes gene_type:complete
MKVEFLLPELPEKDDEKLWDVIADYMEENVPIDFNQKGYGYSFSVKIIYDTDCLSDEELIKFLMTGESNESRVD